MPGGLSSGVFSTSDAERLPEASEVSGCSRQERPVWLGDLRDRPIRVQAGNGVARGINGDQDHLHVVLLVALTTALSRSCMLLVSSGHVSWHSVMNGANITAFPWNAANFSCFPVSSVNSIAVAADGSGWSIVVPIDSPGFFGDVGANCPIAAATRIKPDDAETRDHRAAKSHRRPRATAGESPRVTASGSRRRVFAGRSCTPPAEPRRRPTLARELPPMHHRPKNSAAPTRPTRLRRADDVNVQRPRTGSAP